MKVLPTTVFALALAEKKVPPRTPEQRLNKLSKFYENFADNVIEPQIANGANRAAKFKLKTGAWLDRILNAYNRPTCGYFDPNLSHGGPDPNPDVRPNGKPRNRREDGEEEDDGIPQGDIDEATNEYCADKTAVNYVKADGSPGDGQDHYYCCSLNSDYCVEGISKIAPRSGGKKGGKKGEKALSHLPSIQWKQIITGTRKWIQRYINNCGAQRKHNMGRNRANTLFRKWNNILNF